METSDFKTQHELCHKEFCCIFGVKITTTPFYTHRMVAFSRVRSSQGVYNGGIDLCAIIACLNSCLLVAEDSTITKILTFEQIKISAKFEISK